MARETEYGQVVRYVPAPEPLSMVVVIFVLTLAELAQATMFVVLLYTGDNSIDAQQILAFLLGSAMLTLAAILAIYRRYFLPDVMIVKKRKLKYEDLI